MSLFRYSLSWRSPNSLVGYRLRGCPRGLTQRPDDGASRQSDLEVVVPKPLGAAQQDVGGRLERARLGALAAQDSFGRRAAPWLVGDAADRQAGVLDRVALEFERGCDRYQRERVG